MSGVTTVIYLDGGGVISLEIADPTTTAVIWTPKPYSSRTLSSGAKTVVRSTTDVNQHGASATDKFTSDDIPISSVMPITTTNSQGQTIVYPVMTTTYTSDEGIYTSVLVAPIPSTSISAGESNGGGDTVNNGILATSTIIAIVVAFIVGIAGITLTAFCIIRSRRRRRRREEAARRIAAEAKKEYDEKLARPSGPPPSAPAFAPAAEFTSSSAPSPISPFGDEQRVRYDLPVDVVDHGEDAASINMEHARAISVGRERRNRSRQGDQVPSRARTLDPRRRNDPPVVVTELDSDRASARRQVIRTLPIREGDIQPFILPPMPTMTTRSPPVLNLTIPPETYQPDRAIASMPNWRRTSDIDTLHTLTTDDDDMLAEDGSSIARTLTTESGESGTFPATHGMFRSQHGHDDAFRSESPVAWGPGPFGNEHQSDGLARIGQMAQQTDFDDASTIGEDDGIAPYAPLSLNTTTMRGTTPTLLTGHSTSTGSSTAPPRTHDSLNPFADPISGYHSRPRYPRPPQSEAGRSEVSAAGRTEASFRPGDDARSDVLHLGSQWRSGTRDGPSARNGIAVTYMEDLDSEDDRTTPSATISRSALRNPSVTTGDAMSTADEDDYIRTLEGAISCGGRNEDDREVDQLPPSYNEVFGNTF